MTHLTELKSWTDLKEYAQNPKFNIPGYLKNNVEKKLAATASYSTITIDYSNQKLDETALKLLIKLANDVDLKTKISAMMRGEKVNLSENRPALHTALRAFNKKSLFVGNHNITYDVHNVKEQIKTISDLIRNKKWLGYTNKPITDIVNIGIGGSGLGPKFCTQALSEYCQDDLGYHFIANVDWPSFASVVKKLNPETTLFIVSSKSFTTKETLINMQRAFKWLGHDSAMQKHFIAVTENLNKAREVGFKNILPIWDWVGGRYSLCSAINLITAIAIGYEQFEEILKGANGMDLHFHNTPFSENLPVLLGLIGIWNNNFFNINNLLLLTYSQNLEFFVPYVQQLDMESNGKSVDNNGVAVNYATSPIVWGGSGNQAQHSYLQLLYQGTNKVTIDFITLDSLNHDPINKTYGFKMEVLSKGTTGNEELKSHISGNTSFNHIRLSELSPKSIGEIIALYEHKIYAQSVIWNINAFDQPGVERAKQLLMALESKHETSKVSS